MCFAHLDTDISEFNQIVEKIKQAFRTSHVALSAALSQNISYDHEQERHQALALILSLVSNMAFHPQAAIVAFSLHNYIDILIWDLNANNYICILKGQSVVCGKIPLAFSVDGLLASAYLRHVCLWDFSSSEAIKKNTHIDPETDFFVYSYRQKIEVGAAAELTFSEEGWLKIARDKDPYPQIFRFNIAYKMFIWGGDGSPQKWLSSIPVNFQDIIKFNAYLGSFLVELMQYFSGVAYVPAAPTAAVVSIKKFPAPLAVSPKNSQHHLPPAPFAAVSKSRSSSASLVCTPRAAIDSVELPLSFSPISSEQELDSASLLSSIPIPVVPQLPTPSQFFQNGVAADDSLPPLKTLLISAEELKAARTIPPAPPQAVSRNSSRSLLASVALPPSLLQPYPPPAIPKCSKYFKHLGVQDIDGFISITETLERSFQFATSHESMIQAGQDGMYDGNAEVEKIASALFSFVANIAFHPEICMIALALRNSADILVWNLADNSLECILQGIPVDSSPTEIPQGFETSLAFSPTGILVSASPTEVFIWDFSYTKYVEQKNLKRNGYTHYETGLTFYTCAKRKQLISPVKEIVFSKENQLKFIYINEKADIFDLGLNLQDPLASKFTPFIKDFRGYKEFHQSILSRLVAFMGFEHIPCYYPLNFVMRIQNGFASPASDVSRRVEQSSVSMPSVGSRTLAKRSLGVCVQDAVSIPSESFVEQESSDISSSAAVKRGVVPPRGWPPPNAARIRAETAARVEAEAVSARIKESISRYKKYVLDSDSDEN